MHITEQYKQFNGRGYRVLVAKIQSPDQVLKAGEASIHAALLEEGLAGAIGLYFYRFRDLREPQAFSKIGEVSRREGVIVRKQRGWLATNKYGDSYLKPSTNGVQKVIYSDVQAVTTANPMYFTFYEFDVANSFPKIDEIAAFAKHHQHFGRTTRNKEQANTFDELGRNLVWYDAAFDEVLALRMPSGALYEQAI